MATPAEEIEVDDKVVRVTNPDRVYFPERGWTKLDLVEYYLAVGDGIVNALYERPCMLHRFPTGLAGDKVHQKKVPQNPPPWLETVSVHFPRFNRDVHELCVTELAAVIWAVQMSTVEFHPWNSRRADTEKPDEWRTRCWTSWVPSGGRRPPAAGGCTSTCASRRTMASPTCAGLRRRSRSSWSDVRPR